MRGQGVGTELLRLAEDEAVKRGCKYVYLDTMAYQAPQFYQRRGYCLAGVLEDWDSRGNAKHFYTKRLVDRDLNAEAASVDAPQNPSIG